MKINKEFYSEMKMSDLNKYLTRVIAGYANNKKERVDFEVEISVDFVEKNYVYIKTTTHYSESIAWSLSENSLEKTVNMTDLGSHVLRSIWSDDKEHLSSYHPSENEFVSDEARVAFGEAMSRITVRVLK